MFIYKTTAELEDLNTNLKASLQQKKDILSKDKEVKK